MFVDQINICWGTQPNPVALSNATAMYETYKSLSSASPSATSYPIQLAALQSMTAAPTESHAGGTSDSLSSGAIGGIVGGIVGGIAILGAVAFLLWRRRRKHTTVAQSELPATSEQYADGQQANASEMGTTTAPTAEKYARQENYMAEMPAQQSHFELSAESPHRQF